MAHAAPPSLRRSLHMGLRTVLLLRLLRPNLTDVGSGNTKTTRSTVHDSVTVADDGCLDDPECLLELVNNRSCDYRNCLLAVMLITSAILHVLLFHLDMPDEWVSRPFTMCSNLAGSSIPKVQEVRFGVSDHRSRSYSAPTRWKSGNRVLLSALLQGYRPACS